ncbi:hypothetical protein [Bacillus stratosphericus]|uniref:hypothetical protein n=1 Tax=Bacillus stratosphericus TaxID=293386 RepID=UPI001CF9AAAB|nr:hypothetical protein [Bacillus stratosphericus]
MIRQVKPSDFYAVTSVIQSWWGGRDLRAKLPKLFFEHFQHTSFVVVEKEWRTTIKAVTASINKVFIAYHTKLGFQIEKGDKKVDGISVFSDYDGIHEDRVLFVKRLEEKG